MAATDDNRHHRRRLRAAAALAIPPLTALLFLATPTAPLGASAAVAGRAPAHKPTKPPCTDNCEPPPCTHNCYTPPPPPPPPTCDPFSDSTLICPTDSPSIIVISPVPLVSPTPAGTPSYLLGIPSPSVDPGIYGGGTPIPLGGGFNELPSPNSGPISAISDNSGGGGPPLPLALLGVVLLASGTGWLLFTFGPTGQRFPEPAAPRSRMTLSAYGADTPELTVMPREPASRPRLRRPRSGS